MTCLTFDRIEISKELRLAIKGTHIFGQVPEDQSIRNGTQINLTGTKNKVFKKFFRELGQVISKYIANWKYDGIWSTSMKTGGYHVLHTHPKGWISGVVYIELPDKDSGHFKLLDKTIIPEVGMIILFPSVLPHGTTKYEGGKPRLTIAFDLQHEIHTTPHHS